MVRKPLDPYDRYAPYDPCDPYDPSPSSKMMADSILAQMDRAITISTLPAATAAAIAEASTMPSSPVTWATVDGGTTRGGATSLSCARRLRVRYRDRGARTCPSRKSLPLVYDTYDRYDRYDVYDVSGF